MITYRSVVIIPTLLQKCKRFEKICIKSYKINFELYKKPSDDQPARKKANETAEGMNLNLTIEKNLVII